MSASRDGAAAALEPPPARARRTLAGACLAHVLHDGYTDLIYLLLPVWQAEFGLGYGALAALRGLYAGLMAALQVPSSWLAERTGGRALLAVGTILAAIGYALAGLAGGLVALCAALALSGAGSSTQHPLASAAVSHAYGSAARRPLGIYNFAGDVGKAALPLLAAMLLVVMSWRATLQVVAILGVAAAVAVWMLVPSVAPSAKTAAEEPKPGDPRGFALLCAVGVLDSGVRMGFLTFLPFLLAGKGADLSLVGVALTLVFVGGAVGKYVCAGLGARFGLLPTVLATEVGTAAAIAAVIFLPLVPALIVLPLLGVMLNGTSSVLYGTVSELAPEGRTHRAFAVFYTLTIGSGALSPVLYGVLGDLAGPAWGAGATAMVALLTLPPACLLAPRLRDA